MRRKRLFVIGPLAILGIAAFLAAFGEIVKLLWNWLLPATVGWHPIGFWQAVGLLVLCRILFGGFGRGGHGMRRRMTDRMADRMADRFAAMTPEERERFRQGWRGRCGFGPSSGSDRPSSTATI